jgi:ferritin
MITLPKLISDKVEEFLNSSIKKEMDSAQIYFGMAAWLNKLGYDNGYKLFIKYGNEEMSHAHKLMDFLDNRNCVAVVPVIAKPNQMFTSVCDLIEKTYLHEVDIENNYKTLSTIALREGDHTTYHLAHDYIGEQVEELSKTLDLINLCNINEANCNLPAILEEAFKDRL